MKVYFSKLLLGAVVFLPLLATDSLAHTAEQVAVNKKPKLVLQITVDQLRGDLPTRYYDRLGKGGFRYLLEFQPPALGRTQQPICPRAENELCDVFPAR